MQLWNLREVVPFLRSCQFPIFKFTVMQGTILTLYADLVSRKELHTQMCESVKRTPVGEVLQSVNEVNCEPFYSNYLEDFVRLAHKCKHKVKDTETYEYEVRLV